MYHLLDSNICNSFCTCHFLFMLVYGFNLHATVLVGLECVCTINLKLKPDPEYCLSLLVISVIYPAQHSDSFWVWLYLQSNDSYVQTYHNRIFV